jgi:catechol 2,3-dioxygenase-like lactoylglutathione lyase family enzyme
MAWTLAGKPMAFVNVSERAAALAFYGDRLGLPLLSNDEHGMAFAVGGGILRVTPMPGHQAHPHPVAGWEVDDIGAAARGLLEQGVRLSIYEGFGQDALGIWSAPDGSVKVAWFPDPDGNVLSLTEVRAG